VKSKGIEIEELRDELAETKASRDGWHDIACRDARALFEANKTIEELRVRVAELEASAEFWGRAAARTSIARDAFRSMLIEILASAVPNAREHPTMTKAWARARELLTKEPADA
jgi:hypothetical protein